MKNTDKPNDNAYESERNRKPEPQESKNSGAGLFLLILGIIGFTSIVGSESFTGGTGVMVFGIIILILILSLP